MGSAWNQAWADSWASAWGSTLASCAWGGAWGSSWGQAWCPVEVPEPTVILVGGDDAPRRRQKKRRTQHDLFRELEDTIHDLVHPRVPATPDRMEQVEATAAPPLDAGAVRRAVDELLILAEREHVFLQRTAALRQALEAYERQARLEQDEEDALIWMF